VSAAGPGRILVVAVSARMLAQLAVADGYEVVALDRFGDVDLRAIAATKTAADNDALVTELLGFRPTRHAPLGTASTLYAGPESDADEDDEARAIESTDGLPIDDDPCFADPLHHCPHACILTCDGTPISGRTDRASSSAAQR